MLPISLKQAGQAAVTLGVTYAANKIIEKGFKAYNLRNVADKTKTIPLGIMQKIATAAISIGVGAFFADYMGLIPLSNLASQVRNSLASRLTNPSTTEATMTTASVAAGKLAQEAVKVTVEETPILPSIANIEKAAKSTEETLFTELVYPEATDSDNYPNAEDFGY